MVAYDEGIKFLDRFENGEFEERIGQSDDVRHKILRLQGGQWSIFEVTEESLFEGVRIVGRDLSFTS
ncbi:MAG: hypothetical protein Q9N34_02075 [Aquificota bacterium]|nr:hypothetical protein [Aquificota bacterium]